MSLLWEVIRLAPNMPDAYHTLGALHENANEPLKAINFYMIAAHLDPKVPTRAVTHHQSAIVIDNSGDARLMAAACHLTLLSQF